MSLSTKVRDGALALFASRTLMVGLFDGDREIEDVRYGRQTGEFSEPRSADDDLRFVENTNELQFPDMGKDHHVDGYGLFDEGGALLAVFKLLEPHEPLQGDDNAVFRPGTLRIGVP